MLTEPCNLSLNLYKFSFKNNDIALLKGYYLQYEYEYEYEYESNRSFKVFLQNIGGIFLSFTTEFDSKDPYRFYFKEERQTKCYL